MPEHEDLVVHETDDGGHRIIEFKDAFLNYERTDDIRARLKEIVARELSSECRHIILECSHLGVVDSCGLATLVAVNKQIEQAGGHMSLCGVSEMITRLFELTRLDRVFEVHATAEEAIAASPD